MFSILCEIICTIITTNVGSGELPPLHGFLAYRTLRPEMVFTEILKIFVYSESTTIFLELNTQIKQVPESTNEVKFKRARVNSKRHLWFILKGVVIISYTFWTEKI